MPTEYRLPPSASSLSQSMRDLGYSLATAIADILDNSITAQATKIDIFCVLTGNYPSVSIVDNGNGMNPGELLKAMKHGSVSPKHDRAANDLGRFGLGLKTASFSQCRQMTVISRQSGVTASAQWDLDLVDRSDEWLISILDEQDTSKFEFINELESTGTMVVWCKLDRLFEGLDGQERSHVVNEKLSLVERHLALVFHRYLAGEFKKYGKLRICINGHEILPFDPFCRGNTATQLLPEEKVLVDGHEVKIQPYILPHHSKLSASEYAYYQDRSDFISNQGAYIYRNGRLMAWGDWFRMVPKGESTKLARVQIDFQNALDESWTIDIKKSRARPPPPVRARMRQIIAQITNRGTQVHRRRGHKLFDEMKAPVWERYADSEKIKYSINLQHPLMTALKEELNEEQVRLFNIILNSISSSLPLEMIYSDCAVKPQSIQAVKIENDMVIGQLRFLKTAICGEGNVSALDFRDTIMSTCIFKGQQDLVDEFIRREFDE